MGTNGQTTTELERQLEARYQQRLEQEVARLREQSRKAVEEFKAGFPPPGDAQIEALLYPELREFRIELGGRPFVLRELPALVEKKFLQLVEGKLPAFVDEILSFDEHLGDRAGEVFAKLLSRAEAGLDLVADACLLTLDPSGDLGLTREFVQEHASTARQLSILRAQLLINGGRDFLSRLFPGWSGEPGLDHAIPSSPPRSAGSSSCATPPVPLQDDSRSDNWPRSPGNSKQAARPSKSEDSVART